MLIRPLITEKTLNAVSKNRFTFMVERGANKTEIKKLVEKTFGVTVEKVHTVSIPGKKYRTGKKWSFAMQPRGKKAVVTLKKGQKIDLFDVNPEKPEGEK